MSSTTSSDDSDAIGRPVAVTRKPSDSIDDWGAVVADLNRLLRLRTTPIGMKLFESVAEMEAVPRIRRPQQVHTADQIVSMASRLNWTVGITNDDLVGSQCGAVLGLRPQDDEWRSGAHMAGVWFETVDDSAAHQAAMPVVPAGRFSAMAVSPLATGRLDPPDIAMIYANPAQMILFVNGLQWSGYRKLEWSCVGESSCADSWGRALSTGEPSLSIPCFAERRYGGVPDDELLMALPPHPAEGHRRPRGALGQWPPVSDSALRHPVGCPGRTRRILRLTQATTSGPGCPAIPAS